MPDLFILQARARARSAKVDSGFATRTRSNFWMLEHDSTIRRFRLIASCSRAMRREPTFAEKALWKVLREKRLAGLRFRRQVAMGSYIADFACFSPRLIIELDGAAHQNPDYDAARDRWFEAQGFKVLRFPNDDAVARPSVIVEAILRAAGQGEQRLP